MEIYDILSAAVEAGASDIILSCNKPVQFKIRGQCITMKNHPDPLDKEQTRKLLTDLMSESQLKEIETEREIDFSSSQGKLGRFRVNAFLQQGTYAGVIRTISDNIRSLEELGMPSVLNQLAERPRGLLLITGPTGSGKSTTMAAMIDHINRTREAHILTIEDPIEVVHPHKRSVIEQREVGKDTKSFARALKSALRQAPDVILVGEMRDYETIKAAITAAETGHLVMGTLHTNTAPQTIDRIIDVMPEAQQAQVRVQLAESIVAVVTQTLIPKKGGQGRVIAYELMVATPAIRALIRDGKTNQIVSEMQTGAELGMISMEKIIAKLYTQGVISYEDAVDKAGDVKNLNQFITSMGANVPRGKGTTESIIPPSQGPGGRFGR